MITSSVSFVANSYQQGNNNGDLLKGPAPSWQIELDVAGPNTFLPMSWFKDRSKYLCPETCEMKKM